MSIIETLFPESKFIKLGLELVAIAAVIGGIVWGISVVVGKFEDAARLPEVIKQRDDAKSAYDGLAQGVTTKLNGIAGKLDAMDAARLKADQDAAGNQHAADTEAGNVKGKITHAPRTPNGTRDSGFVADCLRGQLAIPGAGTSPGPCGRTSTGGQGP